MKRNTYVSLLCGFFVAIILFLAVGLTGLPLRSLTFVLPVFYLFVISFAHKDIKPSLISLGLLFASAGDLCRIEGDFIFQTILFIMSYLSYALYLFKGVWLRPNTLFASLALIVLLVVGAVYVLPAVESGVEYVVLLLYFIVRAAMCVGAFLWRHKHRGWYIAAAVLFLVSDCFLILNKYFISFRCINIAIVAPYWAAQFIFTATYLRQFVKKSLFAR